MLSATVWRSRGRVAVEDRDRRNDCGCMARRTAVMAVAGAAAAALAAEPRLRHQCVHTRKEFFMLSCELREAADQPNRQRLTRDLAGIEFELTTPGRRGFGT